MKRIVFHFDVISPFAYLAFEHLPRSLEGCSYEVQYRPLLLAGLLGHWGQKGPAEIEPKRQWTFRHVAWLAHTLDVPLQVPATHPFNPLPLLRLSLAADARFGLVLRLFCYVWSEGRLPEDQAAWDGLLEELKLAHAARRMNDDDVKSALRRNGEEAVARGVFGVPTAVVNGEIFWGADSTRMMLDYLAGHPVFASDEMQRARSLPVGQARKRSSGR